jgi:hypothetical protein
MQTNLKLVETEEAPVVGVMADLVKARAIRMEQESALWAVLSVTLDPILDEIARAIEIERSELADAKRLRQLAKLREEAARGHSVRIGSLLRKAKRAIPHGLFQGWCEEHGLVGASEYIRVARQRSTEL